MLNGQYSRDTYRRLGHGEVRAPLDVLPHMIIDCVYSWRQS